MPTPVRKSPAWLQARNLGTSSAGLSTGRFVQQVPPMYVFCFTLVDSTQWESQGSRWGTEKFSWKALSQQTSKAQIQIWHEQPQGTWTDTVWPGMDEDKAKGQPLTFSQIFWFHWSTTWSMGQGSNLEVTDLIDLGLICLPCHLQFCCFLSGKI